MTLFQSALDFIFQLDKHLIELIGYCGPWTYFIFAFILFLETGVLIFSFLPGDSLLFAIGILAKLHPEDINVYISIFFLILGAFVGNTANYYLAQFIGQKIIKNNPTGKVAITVNHVYDLMQQYGGWAIVYSRFVPFVRSVAPFAAGIARMNYSRFQFYNILGAVLWVSSCTLIGYFIGGGKEGSTFTKIIIGVLILIIVMFVIYKKLKIKLEMKKYKSLIL